MDKLINLRNADGEVIRVLDGRFTLGQVILVGVAILILIIAFHVTKKAIHTAIVGCVLVAVLIYFGNATPEQLEGAAAQIKAKGVEAYEAIVAKSDNLKIEDGDIYIKLGEEWHNISEVTSFVTSADGSITINLGGKKFVLNDSMVGGLLEAFADKENP